MSDAVEYFKNYAEEPEQENKSSLLMRTLSYETYIQSVTGLDAEQREDLIDSLSEEEYEDYRQQCLEFLGSLSGKKRQLMRKFLRNEMPALESPPQPKNFRQPEKPCLLRRVRENIVEAKKIWRELIPERPVQSQAVRYYQEPTYQQPQNTIYVPVVITITHCCGDCRCNPCQCYR